MHVHLHSVKSHGRLQAAWGPIRVSLPLFPSMQHSLYTNKMMMVGQAYGPGETKQWSGRKWGKKERGEEVSGVAALYCRASVRRKPSRGLTGSWTRPIRGLIPPGGDGL